MTKGSLLFVISVLLLAVGCSDAREDKMKMLLLENVPHPESTVVLHQEELEKVVLFLYKDQSGLRQAFYSHELGQWGRGGNGELAPEDGLDWSMSYNPAIPLVTFSGVITDEEIDQVIVRQKTMHKEARIIESTELGRIWFTYFDTLERSDPGQGDPLKIEGWSNEGELLWRDGIYEGVLVRGKP